MDKKNTQEQLKHFCIFCQIDVYPVQVMNSILCPNCSTILRHIDNPSTPHPEPTEHINSIEDKNKQLLKALQRLVDLKHHKDNIGKSEYYLREQPEAWATAKSLVAIHTMGIDSDFKIVQSESKQETSNSIEEAAEAILDDKFLRAEAADWYKPVLNAMKELATSPAAGEYWREKDGVIKTPLNYGKRLINAIEYLESLGLWENWKEENPLMVEKLKKIVANK